LISIVRTPLIPIDTHLQSVDLDCWNRSIINHVFTSID
jgi:hypothetical protein